MNQLINQKRGCIIYLPRVAGDPDRLATNLSHSSAADPAPLFLRQMTWVAVSSPSGLEFAVRQMLDLYSRNRPCHQL